MRKELFNSVRRLDVLQNFIDDDSVTEIMVNGLQSIFIERSGRLFRCPEHFSSQEKLQDVIQRIVALSNRVANEAVPIVDARLENGARVNIVMNHNPEVSRPSHLHAAAGRMGLCLPGSGRLSEKTGESRLQHLYLRRNRLRENDLFKRTLQLHPERRTDHYSRG